MTTVRRTSITGIRDSPVVELLWYARLRWVAGAVILGVGAASWIGGARWLVEAWPVFVVVGGVVLAYSAVLSLVIRSRLGRGEHDGTIRLTTAGGVALDLMGLAALVSVTGGLHSPAIGLFVLHMVFVSLLMPLHMSYVAAGAAMVLVAIALGVTGLLPSSVPDALVGSGWAGSLVLVAYMTDHIARSLRSQDERLHQHQRAAAQHEKMTALGQMTAGVVHEIANPLSNMDSILQLVARRPESLTPETADALREQIGRIKTILQQMRSFAHPDHTGSERVVLDEVVEGALSLVRFDKRLKRLDLRRALGCDSTRVDLNPHALQQVLVNLITNALDALDGVERPRLGVETKSEEAGRCVIRVSDNGSGMSEAVLERVFDPFFTTKPVGYGTGLGLSISYRLVEGMGGEIRVGSKQGAGTTFTIELPIAESDSSARDSPGETGSRN